MEKSFLKVISPHKFIPAIINDERNFEHLWNSNKAWVFSNLSHIAYFRKEKVMEFMEKLGAPKTIFYDHRGAQAFLSIWDDKAILSFRGTQPIEHPTKKHDHLTFFHKIIIKLLIKLPINPFSLLFLNNDVIADFKFCHASFNKKKNVCVHSGFLEEIKKLWKPIFGDIKKLNGTVPIWVTGHSLGGAMATIAGMQYPFEAVTTFGEPRVGRKVTLSFEAKKHTRFVNGDDPVTKLPPKFFSYYKHHGNKKPITDHNGETDFIYDHSIIYYSENLY